MAPWQSLRQGGGMQAAPDGGASRQGKASFKARFRTWWDGDEPPPPKPIAKPARSAAPKRPAAPASALDRADVKVSQQVWAEGFIRPGGDASILNLVRPFALNPSMTVMDFGAGLGGGTRAISKEFGVWVTGFEPDPDLAAAAQELSTRLGTKKAEIKHYRQGEFFPKPGSFDCIFSGETLHLLAEKEKLLGVFEHTLKARGQIVITDFLRAPGTAPDDPKLAEFSRRPGHANHFWTEEEYLRQLQALKFDVRVDEDLTAQYRGMVINSWVDFTANGGSAACAKEFPKELVAEVAFWTQRLAAMDSGAVHLKRYYAIKMGSAKTI